MAKDFHVVFASVNALIVKKGKVLLSRRQNKSWGNGLLCLPGGHVQEGETPRQALLREVQEETGLEMTTSDLQFCCVAQRMAADREYVAYEFVLKLAGATEPYNAEPEECSELIWCDPKKLPKDVIPDFAAIITEGYLGGQAYLEIGYTVAEK